MKSLDRVKYNELPMGMRASIVEDDFLRACVALNVRNRILWIVDRKKNRRSELEWDFARSRFLTRDEREDFFENERSFDLLQIGVGVTVRQYLEAGTDALYESFHVYSLESGEKLFEISQDVYSPARRDMVELVGLELKRISFPLQYEAWSLDKKISHWVALLYRFRHQVGEQGEAEDDAFDLALIEKMRSVDPDIESILMPIIVGLAAMEGDDVKRMAQSFSSRTGINVNVL